MTQRRLPRRDFLGAVALAALPAAFRDDPYRLLPRTGLSSPAVRVRGRVAALGRGLARVALSDGRSVVTTDRDGRFELVTNTARRFLSLSLPSGHRIPTHPAGTARSFVRLAPNPAGEMAVAFDLEPIPGGDERHAFLTLADIQTQDDADMGLFRRDTVPDVQRTIRALGEVPTFGVAAGDIMWDKLSLYDDYEAAVRELGIPFVQVVGNHDLDMEQRSDGRSTTTFERRFGPRYWSFNRGQVHYVVLDDVMWYGDGYIGYVDDDQLAWLAEDLALVERGRPVVVFAHIPLLSNLSHRNGLARAPVGNYVTNREAVYGLLAPYRTTILTGHIHDSDWSTAGGVFERNLGAVCGGWWTGPICYDGTPNGYAVHEVNGAELRWRYQATGQAADHQIRVYPRGADPKAPDEIVANVWAFEPGWTVVWYENGARRGAMARRVGLDPLAVQTLAGADLPARRGWVDPVPTGHLFYAPVAAGARDLRVEATDPFGRTYSATLRQAE